MRGMAAGSRSGGDDASATLGSFIRRQRALTDMTMRQLAVMTGISNPYLSQIENGLREPSEQVLTALADALEVSVEDLRGAAGMRRDAGRTAVAEAIRNDPDLTAAQRRALLEVHRSMAEATRAQRGTDRD